MKKVRIKVCFYLQTKDNSYCDPHYTQQQS